MSTCAFCENGRDVPKVTGICVLSYKADITVQCYYCSQILTQLKLREGNKKTMQFKKSKTILAAFLAAAVTCSAVLPTVASAAGTRTEEEAYGDDTYAARFMSLYDDVVTNGVENGYMSSANSVDGGLGIPYHSVETLCIEAPDYGHETTSEALSYLVWVAAMRDNIVNDVATGETEDFGNTKYVSDEEVGDLAAAWLTMESTMIPDYQNGFQSANISATYSDEWGEVSDYPTDMDSSRTATNPIYSYFRSTYSDDEGLYLMHWLADVDDWYGYGEANGSSYQQENVDNDGSDGVFTLINTFQRGEQESCWETIPHACIDLHNKGYGLTNRGGDSDGNGMKGFFNTESNPAEQWSYTNAPDAEDRAIQAVYAANRWGVGDQDVSSKWGGTQDISALAAKMGDELQNNMYDKYYQAIGVGYGNEGQNVDDYSWNVTDESKHYLMNWYTSWGGAKDGSWAWQIGASHMHEFYQNPLAAYALADGGSETTIADYLASDGTSIAVSNYETSLERQIEFYLWLSSADGLFAGGATNSLGGQYEGYSEDESTFYEMIYQEHPVYADPGSNHWIGNQVWAAQRLAELYYYCVQDGYDIEIADTGMTITEALKTVLDKWVSYFLDNTILGTASETETLTYYYEPYDTEETTSEVPVLSSVEDDGISFSIPSSVIWDGEPETWTGQYQENEDLTCTIVGYGDGDLGCVSSLANTLIYYAAANAIGEDGTVSEDDMEAYAEAYYENFQNTASGDSDGATTMDDEDRAGAALYLAQQLLDREWESYRDDIGLGVADHNTNLVRLWETELELPDGSTENGDGNVLSASDYVGTMPNGDAIEDGVAFVDIRSNYEDDEMYQEALYYYESDGDTEDYYFTLHRFWHAGDIMMALGAMYELYPDLTPTTVSSLELTIDPDEIEVGETATLTATLDDEEVDATFTVDDESIATVDGSTITGVSEGEVTVTATYTDEDGNEYTTTETLTVTASDEDTQGLLGDVNVNGEISLADAVVLNRYTSGLTTLSDLQQHNADVNEDDTVDSDDYSSLMEFLVGTVTSLPTD